MLHDFDKAGFSILGTLHRSARRYQYRNRVEVIDLGLRIEDIAGLETEDVFINSKEKAAQNLVENGASPEEVEFLLEQRVEINAFPSDELISWLESKLDQHGVAKVTHPSALWTQKLHTKFCRGQRRDAGLNASMPAMPIPVAGRNKVDRHVVS